VGWAACCSVIDNAIPRPPVINAATIANSFFISFVLSFNSLLHQHVLLVRQSTLKDGKQNLYFLLNYFHVVNERLERRFLESPVSLDDVTLALLKVLFSRKCTYYHISLQTGLVNLSAITL
jgi:hypothetical protein